MTEQLVHHPLCWPGPVCYQLCPMTRAEAEAWHDQHTTPTKETPR